MQIFKYITALYIFFALLLLALATAVAISYEPFTNYAYSFALVLHSFAIFYAYILALQKGVNDELY